jgi:hypothetical protein
MLACTGAVERRGGLLTDFLQPIPGALGKQLFSKRHYRSEAEFFRTTADDNGGEDLRDVFPGLFG